MLAQQSASPKNSLIADHRFGKALVYVILLAVFLRIAAALWLGDAVEGVEQVRVMDQISYNRLAQAILAGKGYTFSIDWYPFTPANTPTAHWSFIYPLYLAGIYAITGYHPLAARLVQCVISACLTAWLLYRIGRRVFDDRTGLAAAGLGAVYIYFVFYDASLMTESFFLLGILAMFDLSLHIADRMRARQAVPRRWWVALGVVLGVSALLRQTILLWVPFLAAWFLWQARGKFDWGGLALTLGLMGLLILPWTVRNYRVYKAFLPLNSNAGYAFYSANHPYHGVQFDQDYGAPLPADLAGQVLNEAQLNTALIGRGMQFILDDPVRYLRLSLSRIPIFFNAWFSPESRLSSNLMRMLAYGVYLPFYLYGLFLSFRSWRKFSLFYLFCLVYTVMHVLSWASVRYRLPIDAVMLPFAAGALLDLYRRFRLQRLIHPARLA